MRFLALFLGLFLWSCDSYTDTFTFSAGELDREHSLVQFPFDRGAPPAGQRWILTDLENGQTIPLQLLQDGEAAVLLDQPLAAGEKRTYGLSSAPADEDALQAKQDEAELMLAAGDRPILTYHIATDCPPKDQPQYYCRSGYIHPLRSPGGAVVTDGFPVGHTHQHGLFFAWVDNTFRGDFTDFWNQQKETGTVAHRELTGTTSGDVFTGFSSRLQQISLEHGPVLDEKWKITAYDLGDYYVLNFVSTQNNITEDTLHINEYHYGGLGIRGNAAWNAVDSLAFRSEARFLTSEGKARVEANHSRPLWTAMYGETKDGVAGVAVLDHPDNFRHPQPVRVHPTMPYFCLAPMVEGAMPIAPGQTYVSRYRIVTFDGEPDVETLNRMWKDYALPLEVATKSE